MPLLGSGPPPPKTIAILEISDRINAFTLDLLKHYASGAEAGQNTILSPQSIFHGLAISYVASDGETRKELARVLHFPDNDQKLMDDLVGLRRQLAEAANRKKIDVSVANSLWLDSTHAEFRKDYVKKVENAFAASLHSVNFQQPGRVSGEINKWVAEKTHGKIQRTVDPKDFASRSGPDVIDEPALVSVNAVYFKADWGSRFEKGATRDGPFHVDPNTTVNAPMMHQRSLLAYAADDDFKFLEIPYVDGQYSMYILLPNQVLGVKQLMARITAETIVRLKRASAAYRVDVLLPRFTLQGHYGITGTLTEMGVRSAFDRRQADFDKMIVKRMEAYRIYISEVYHDAWIEVHEEGTEAAAATSTTHFSIGCSASPSPMPVDFHADHPFLFAIVDNKSYSILFAGWITNPKSLTPQVQPSGK